MLGLPYTYFKVNSECTFYGKNKAVIKSGRLS